MAWWDKMGPGLMVTRATRVIANENYAIFNVAGGRVLLTALIGLVTTVCAATANVYLRLVPTLGTATTSDLCVASDVDATPEGDIMGITGVPTDALYPGGAATRSALPAMTVPVVLIVGALQYCSDAASGGGAIQWEVWYKPLDDAGYVVAA